MFDGPGESHPLDPGAVRHTEPALPHVGLSATRHCVSCSILECVYTHYFYDSSGSDDDDDDECDDECDDDDNILCIMGSTSTPNDSSG